MVCFILPHSNLDSKSLAAYYIFGFSKGQVTFMHIQYARIINFKVANLFLRLLSGHVIFSSIQPLECGSVD